MENEIELTEEQNGLIEHVKNNIHKKDYLVIGGTAGSGKSTCLSYLKKLYPHFKVCAFTGKAANVLRKKGVDAQTIHSTIYKCEYTSRKEPVFTLRESHDIFYRQKGGFLIDEASMVNGEIMEDLLSFGVPVVFIGDHAQLEPIGSHHNIMQNPDYRLETIHRNANNIAKFANFLRKGGSAINFPPNDRVKLISKKEIDVKKLVFFDQIICAYNKTRLQINNQVRSMYGYNEKPQINDKIICLKNNHRYNVFNGMLGYIRKLEDKTLTFETEDGASTITLPINLKQFNQEKVLECASQDKHNGYFDFAYCITCHKAQGDEWNNVLVIHEPNSKWDNIRWAYTAASRAKELLVWAM